MIHIYLNLVSEMKKSKIIKIKKRLKLIYGIGLKSVPKKKIKKFTTLFE